MDQKNITTVVDNQLCSGCGTCRDVCGSEAIQIQFSPMGRLLPEVNEDSCTNCGLCLKFCPGIDLSGSLQPSTCEDPLFGNCVSTYAGRSTNEKIFQNAQSGGAVTETLCYLFDTGKIDAALIVVQQNLKAAYSVVTEKEGVLRGQSSQYTPVDLNSGLSGLRGYKSVAVVGLPCHIEGIIKLREKAPKRVANIHYLLGLICAGTLTQRMSDVILRLKRYSSYKNAETVVVSEQGEITYVDGRIRHLCKPLLTPPRCRLCHDKMNLFCDIVYGDVWGVNGDDVANGGNVIITRSNTGEALIRDMMDDGRLALRVCTSEEIIKGQGLEQKHLTICQSIRIYTEKGWKIPGWSTSHFFDKDTPNNKVLYNEISRFIKLDEKREERVMLTLICRLRLVQLQRKVKSGINKVFHIY